MNTSRLFESLVATGATAVISPLIGYALARKMARDTKAEIMNDVVRKYLPTVAVAAPILGFAGGVGAGWMLRKGMKPRKPRAVRESSEPERIPGWSPEILGDTIKTSVFDLIHPHSPSVAKALHTFLGGPAVRKYGGATGAVRTMLGSNPIIHPGSEGGFGALGSHVVKNHPMLTGAMALYALGNAENLYRAGKRAYKGLKQHIKGTVRRAAKKIDTIPGGSLMTNPVEAVVNKAL